MRLIEVLACLAILPFLVIFLAAYAVVSTAFVLGLLTLVAWDAFMDTLRKG